MKDVLQGVPSSPLFHYTSLTAFKGMVESKALWATDIHYLNDSSEISHALSRFTTLTVRRLSSSSPTERKVLSQLSEWVSFQATHQHRQFVFCFTEHDNLLSQWRAYCPYGNGLNIGFPPKVLTALATNNDFLLCKCRYEQKDQDPLLDDLLNKFIATAKSDGEAPPSDAAPEQSYHPTFRKLEDDLLLTAATFKSPVFREEGEWRAISKVQRSLMDNRTKYRGGASTMIPYVEIKLIGEGLPTIALDSIRLGATPNSNLSMHALSAFLAQNEVTYRELISPLLPYRIM